MYKMIRIPMRRTEVGARVLVVRFGSFDVAKKCYSSRVFEIAVHTNFDEMDELTGAIGDVKPLISIESKKATNRMVEYMNNDWLKYIPEPEFDVDYDFVACAYVDYHKKKERGEY